MKKDIFAFRFILFFLVSTVFASVSLAGVHGGMSFGGWKSWYKQEGFSQSVNVATDWAPALKFCGGVSFGPFFIDYTPEFYHAFFGSRITGVNAEANDMSYFSLLAGNVGLDIPVINLRPYFGGGIGNVGFVFGTEADPSGPFVRVGVDWGLYTWRFVSVGPKVEVQRIFLKNDEAGALPEGYSARSDIIFFGLSVRLGY